ncbi:hypothetical protein H2787_18040 (plasmid) [Acinetobacter baumannii]|uniref:Uncharacterized protein n=1 Tax=Acinetobacter baumannii TaxID=470 RepID=A0A9Q8L2M6_ACIBA|nr:hypothetical protein H2787_18040 [Acinetobacter baumannii]
MIIDESFLEDYQKLRMQVLSFDYTDIPNELSNELNKLYKKAHSIQNEIITARKIGTEFRYASLTYGSRLAK